MDERFNLEELKEMISGYDTDESKLSLDEIISSNTNDLKDNAVQVTVKESKEIDADVVKPDGVSITGAFEAIKNQKNTDKNIPNDKNVDIPVEIKNETKDVVCENNSVKKPSIEITAEIAHKRYFSTEEFESIKNKDSANIKESIASFTKGSEEEDDGEEEFYQARELTEEIDDFETPEEREDILLDLKKMNSSASFKSIATFVLLSFSAVIFIAIQFGISIPGLEISSGSKLVLSILFGSSVVASIVNINSLIKGVAALSKFACTPETMLFFVFVFNTALDLMYLLGGKSFNGHFISFDFIYILLLTFNIFAKKLLVKNIYKNFLIASSNGQKMVVNRPETEAISNDIILETGNGGDILYATKSKFVSDFIHNSFKDFELSSKGSKFYTFCSVVIILLSFVNLIVYKDISNMLIYAVGAFCVATPVLLTYSFAVSVYTNSKKARRFGGAIVGSESAYDIQDAQTLIVDDSDVFNIALNGVRLYGHTEIDDCVLYLNSLFSVVGGPLKSLFKDMINDSAVSMPRADEIFYHDTMGYSCLIHSKLFVVGNKALMDHFNIEVDDSEFEIIYQQKSKNVLFVAYDGELIGVFLLTYSLSHGVSKAFSVLESDQLSVAIAERDANITNTLLHGSFKTSDKSLFTIMKFRTARNFFDKFELQNKTPSILLSNTGLKGIAYALHGCKSILFAFKANKIINIISSIIAILLITFLLVFSEPSLALPIQVLLFQALWSLPILFVSMFSK